jgi:hypothetical protein
MLICNFNLDNVWEITLISLKEQKDEVRVEWLDVVYHHVKPLSLICPIISLCRATHILFYYYIIIRRRRIIHKNNINVLLFLLLLL